MYVTVFRLLFLCIAMFSVVIYAAIIEKQADVRLGTCHQCQCVWAIKLRVPSFQPCSSSDRPPSAPHATSRTRISIPFHPVLLCGLFRLRNLVPPPARGWPGINVLISSLHIALVISPRAGLLNTYKSLFSLDDSLAEIKTREDVSDYLRVVSERARLIQPLSSAYFLEESAELKILSGFAHACQIVLNLTS
jgi:hypothetical protein